MDSRDMRINGKSFQQCFNVDQYGLIYPKADILPLSYLKEKVSKVNNAAGRTGLKRVRAITANTDVAFTSNPLGNTPVIGAGYKLFGDRPLKKVSRDELLYYAREGFPANIQSELDERQARLDGFNLHVYEMATNLVVADDDERTQMLKLIEIDQSLTGGGFDNNRAGDITKSAMDFVTTAHGLPEIQGTVFSELLMLAFDRQKKRLMAQGLRPHSLSPVKYSKVRHSQDNDGMIGWPVLASAYDELEESIAHRLYVYTGVRCNQLVGTTVTDTETGNVSKARVLDCIEYVMSQYTYVAHDLPLLILVLARIQKHGFKWSDEEGLISKDGKARSVYPDNPISGSMEAMVFQAFNEKIQELQIDFMPSLQNKETRVKMIKEWVSTLPGRDMDALPADWSGYDKTLLASAIASYIINVVGYFFKEEYESWMWAVAYSYVYKLILMETEQMDLNPEEAAEVRKFEHFDLQGFEIYPCLNGLVSGKKGTHVLGSGVGLAEVHYVVPWILGYEPDDKDGSQAGDDTLLAIPKSFIHDSVIDTYKPISEAAAQLGLVLNESKQMFHRSKDGEMLKVFLQESYHAGLDIWGVGTIFRPYAAEFTAEYDKKLAEADQYMAEIARLNQGHDSPFVEGVVSDWFEHEQVLGLLFQEFNEDAWDILIEASGGREDLLSRLDVGSFTFSVDTSSLEDLSLPIIETLAQVAAEKEFTSVDSSVRDRVNRIKTSAG